MTFYRYKGKRIRASDKNLVYHFCVGSPVHSGTVAVEHGTAQAYRLGSVQPVRQWFYDGVKLFI